MGRRKSRRKESRHAGGESLGRAELIEEASSRIARHGNRLEKLQRIPGGRRGDQSPEFPQFFDPAHRIVAGNDGGVDGADRDARHPIGMKPGFGQPLIDAALVGAERAAALERQCDAFEGRAFHHVHHLFHNANHWNCALGMHAENAAAR